MKFTKEEIKKTIEKAANESRYLVVEFKNGASCRYQHVKKNAEISNNKLVNKIYKKAHEENNSIFYNPIVYIGIGEKCGDD